MTRTKTLLVTCVIAAATAGAAATPALADSHAPTPPRDGHIPITAHQDGHSPTAPLGDGHAPTPPQG
ncbi:hypothetical protein [Streptomyces sp. NPDC003006]